MDDLDTFFLELQDFVEVLVRESAFVFGACLDLGGDPLHVIPEVVEGDSGFGLLAGECSTRTVRRAVQEEGISLASNDRTTIFHITGDDSPFVFVRARCALAVQYETISEKVSAVMVLIDEKLIACFEYLEDFFDHGLTIQEGVFEREGHVGDVLFAFCALDRESIISAAFSFRLGLQVFFDGFLELFAVFFAIMSSQLHMRFLECFFELGRIDIADLRDPHGVIGDLISESSTP